MSLRWDPLLVRELAAELAERLVDARLRAIRLDGDARDLTLLFRDETLLWRLHPTRGSLSFHPPREPTPKDLPLRARVRTVRAPADERILHVELAPLRRAPARMLVVELLGNQWNAVVTEGAEARVRHVLVRRGPPRPLRVGQPYSAPPPSDRSGVDGSVALEQWTAMLAQVPPPGRAKELVRRVAWTSSINAAAFVDADPDPDEALRRGHTRWRAMVTGGGPVTPVVLSFPRGPQPYPFRLPGVEGEPVPSLVAALGSLAEVEPGQAVLAEEASFPPELLTRLERAVDDQRRRCVSLEAKLASAEEPAELRSVGDLLLARVHDVPRGADSATLEGFDGVRVEVRLDPKMTPAENADAYYQRATKAARARERLPRLLRESEERRAELEELLAAAVAGEADPARVRSILPERPPKGSGTEEPSLPYRTYRSSGGLEIRVGRGARHNDDLTFRHSAPADVWLHARHAAGAHVVLRWTGPGSPPARDLEEAAVLAALHSKARTSGSVPVDWTLRKYVRKPRGAHPGSVVMQRAQTLFVEPDPELAERLAVE